MPSACRALGMAMGMTVGTNICPRVTTLIEFID